MTAPLDLTALAALAEAATRSHPCPMCEGSGSTDFTSFVDPTQKTQRSCLSCKGKGKLPPRRDDVDAFVTAALPMIREIEGLRAEVAIHTTERLRLVADWSEEREAHLSLQTRAEAAEAALEKANAEAGAMRDERDAAVRTAEEWQAWDDDPLPEDEAIDAAFPTRTGNHAAYGEAMRLVGARHSKGALVALVNWLLVRKALSTDAGRAMVEELAALRVVRDAAQALRDEEIRMCEEQERTGAEFADTTRYEELEVPFRAALAKAGAK